MNLTDRTQVEDGSVICLCMRPLPQMPFSPALDSASMAMSGEVWLIFRAVSGTGTGGGDPGAGGETGVGGTVVSLTTEPRGWFRRSRVASTSV